MVRSGPRPPKPDERAEILVRRRRLKMARSAHAYVRGSTTKFYEWLEQHESTLPEGPPVWICGDCHAGNLGPLAAQDGQIELQIRDLDQTVIGNPAHDVIRLGLSLASVARGADVPGAETARMIEDMVEGYRDGLAHASTKEVQQDEPEIVKLLLKQASKRKWRHLAAERTEGKGAELPIGKTFWPLSKTEVADLAELFETSEVQSFVAALGGLDDGAAAIEDAAYWVKGCSSLGRLRYAVVLSVQGGKDDDDRYRLVDIKEGVTAAAPRNRHAKMPRDNAERVVTGARSLSPHLGERMLAGRLGSRSVVIRELMPQDVKIEADILTQKEGSGSARYLAAVVGRAHGRQMDSAHRKSWSADLAGQSSKSLDAPSWLWRSVVDLLATHEAAYLEHCRRYALQDED